VTNFAIGIPNLREYADPRLLVELARESEAAGWDAFFVWDHMAAGDGGAPATDPWIALAGIAVATERIKLGALITPLARRRPWKVARETVALDLLSDGRLVVGVGLGAHAEEEFAAFGEDPDPKVRAAKLDEGLDVLLGLWSGQPLDYEGEHLQVHGAQFTPVALQRPRIPVWVGGTWPNRRPFRRAARFDGVFPTSVGVGHAEMMDPAELGAIVRYVAEHRESDRPFEVAYEAQSGGVDRAADADKVARYAAEGLTWWVEKLGWFRGDVAATRARIAAGPPTG
jgi:alkanesulfonate monooxygenase SsuD/methylene tetrahydromethanopterin reductase-like flavin-dependent oxidoreductase (luciferase family)